MRDIDTGAVEVGVIDICNAFFDVQPDGNDSVSRADVQRMISAAIMDYDARLPSAIRGHRRRGAL